MKDQVESSPEAPVMTAADKVCVCVYRLQYGKVLGTCIRMRIRCLTWSTWKDRNGEARSAGETMLCCPPPIPSRVSERSNRLGGGAQVVSCHRYLVVFHPFVEQLTVFHTSGLVLASSSIFQVLDLDLHRVMAS